MKLVRARFGHDLDAPESDFGKLGGERIRVYADHQNGFFRREPSAFAETIDIERSAAWHAGQLVMTELVGGGRALIALAVVESDGRAAQNSAGLVRDRAREVGCLGRCANCKAAEQQKRAQNR